jgi:hypothetical protein
MSSDPPLGKTGGTVDAWIRIHGRALLEGETARPMAPPVVLGEAFFRSQGAANLQPARLPSLPYRGYNIGDSVAIGEIVIRHKDTGVMMVVYPGSVERQRWSDAAGWKQLAT